MQATSAIDTEDQIGDSYRADLSSGLTFTGLLGGNFPAPTPIVEGVLYEGHSAILGGAFGQGKTFFSLQLSVCAALGREFLGRAIARPYRTLFIDTENGGGEIKSRIQALVERMRLDELDLAHLDSHWRVEDYSSAGVLQYLDLSTLSGMQALDRYIAIYEPEIIIMDCFGKVFLKEEKDEPAIKLFTEGLKQLIRKHKCLQRGSILLLHHLRKPMDDSSGPDLLTNPTDFLWKIRGSGRLLDFVQDRLALHEVHSFGETYSLVNGVLRSGVAVPLIMQREDDGFFGQHQSRDLVERCAFGTAGMQFELYTRMKNTFPGGRTFTFTEAKGLPSGAVKWANNTVTNTLKRAVQATLIFKAEGGYQFPIPPT